MERKLKFVLCLHSHQPVGNLDHVFEAIYRESYDPFLTVFEAYPDVPVSLHTSGPLLEWLDDHHPDYLDRMAAMAARGQAEIIGGAFYEPILTLLPVRDRLDQIRFMQRWIQARFGVEAAGFWLAERVWEQALVHDLAAAGVAFTMVDHTHFNYGGIPGVPAGYYTAEDRGATVQLFPINEDLRYLIPFAEPEAVLDYLKAFHDRSAGDPVVVYGDDGEKFGSWPGTAQRVYEEQWLARFFELLLDNRDWLEVTSFREVLREQPSRGLAYLPDASYREMMTWALEPEDQLRLDRLHRRMKKHTDMLPFIRGGSWRNFRKKYPESYQMYTRMLDLSDRVETDAQRTHLHRAQCNCAYWHGVFGGIYLPHLRGAVHEEIIAGERLLKAEPERATRDLDRDGHDEWILTSREMKAVLDPDMGGRLLHLDLRQVPTNLQATFTRRPEPYHRYVTLGGAGKAMTGVHDIPVLKEPGLQRYLVYDRYQRLSLLDHRLTELPTPEQLHDQDYPVDLPFTHRPLTAEPVQEGVRMQDPTTGIHKTVTLSGRDLVVRYTDDAAGFSGWLAVEWNLFTLSADAPDKGFFAGDQFIGPAGIHAARTTESLQFRDEYRGFSLRFSFSQPAEVRIAPVYTVNLSESGIEKVFQNSTLLVAVPLPLAVPFRITVQYR